MRTVLVTITPAARPITNSGRAAIDAEVEQHSDREEEQAEQDRAERLDVAFELVAVGRFGEHHAGDEGAERHRQVERVHHRRGADDGEQARDDEQLALAEAADQPEQRVEDEPADERPARSPRAPCRAPSFQPVGALGSGGVRAIAAMIVIIGTIDEVLEQQDREGALALRRVELVVRAQHRQHLRGRRQRRAAGRSRATASGEMPSAT